MSKDKLDTFLEAFEEGNSDVSFDSPEDKQAIKKLLATFKENMPTIAYTNTLAKFDEEFLVKYWDALEQFLQSLL
jgi:hypothetical protein